jgi:hypothetical protein
MRLLDRSFRPALASLILLAAILPMSAASAAAEASVKYEPPEGRPGTEVSVSGLVCGYYQGDDQLWFSDRFVPQLSDGSTVVFDPVAAAALTPISGAQTEYGIQTSAQAFIVPRLPAGDYYLYAACTDADACCVPLEPTFRILGTPNTSTTPPPQAQIERLWLVVVLGFVVGLAMMALRVRSSILRSKDGRH